MSKAEIESRVQDIYGLVVDGAPFRVIRQYMVSKCDWQVEDRALRGYIRQCTDRFVEDAETDRERLRAQAALRLNRVYAMQVQKQDLRGAVMTQAAINRLFGLDAPARTELTGADGAPLQAALTVDELGALFDELVERQAKRLGTDADAHHA